MSVRTVTNWEPNSELLAGHFQKSRAYSNWRPVGSGDWLLIYTEAGSGTIVTPRGVCETQVGDAILYAPSDLQDYGTSPIPGKWRLIWAHFTPKAHWQQWLHWPTSENGVRRLQIRPGEVRKHFHAALVRMLKFSRRELNGSVDLSANALEEALLWARIGASKDPWLAMDRRVRKAIDHLVENLREPFSLGNLAKRSGLSVSRLAALFKLETGNTPQQFFERHRLQRACQLLRSTNMSIAEVAGEVGYADPFYFSNRFRRFAGKSPSRYAQREAKVGPRQK